MLKNFKTLTLQIFIVAVSFFLMAFISFNFINRTINYFLVANAEGILNTAVAKVEYTLKSPRYVLDGFAISIENIINNHFFENEEEDVIRTIENYMVYLNTQFLFYGKEYIKPDGFFGYVLIDGKFHHLAGIDNIPHTIEPSTRDWFINAKNNNEIIETLSFPDILTHNLVVIYSRSIYDKFGDWLGVVAIRVDLTDLEEILNSIVVNSVGYSTLVYRDSRTLIHHNKEFIGLSFIEIESLSAISFASIRYDEIYNHNFINYRDEKSIIFIKRMENDWFLTTIVPTMNFYRASYNLVIVLSVCSLFFSLFIIIILIKIEKERVKANLKNEYKSIFLANMSHEIRTPINIIIGMSSIGKSAEDITKKEYCFNKIHEASEHLLGIINDILDLSKIEANKLELNSIEFVYRDMIQNIVDLYSVKINERSQILELDIDKNIPQVLVGDEQRLAQVIINLLSNAVKFTPENGKISIVSKLLSRESNFCVIKTSIIDTGIGLTQEQQDKLFKSFQQADRDTYKKFGGTGLGLSISKHIIEMMNGIVWVESEYKKGSSFIFIVKMKEGTTKKIPMKNDNEENVDLKDMTILLVEDIEINREIITTLLEPTNIKIDVAINGKEAIKMFTKNPDKYNIIFMDVQMPEMNGIEATKAIRNLNLDNAKTIPIIAMTASVLSSDIQDCIDAGMNDHIGKPLDINKIIKKLKFYLGKNK